MRAGFHTPTAHQRENTLHKAQDFIHYTETWLERLKAACSTAQLPFDDEAEVEDMLRWAYTDLMNTDVD